jgi:hypothetical protein
MQVNETHRAELRRWVESANAPETDFPIQNLPYGILPLANAEHLSPPPSQPEYVLSLRRPWPPDGRHPFDRRGSQLPMPR